MIFWLNGDYRQDSAAIDVADRGFLLGDGVFETIYVEAGVPVFLGAHLARLKQGLAALQINAVIPDNIGKIIAALTGKNGLTNERASARITVARGPSGRGLLFPEPADKKPTLLVTIFRVQNKEQDKPTSLMVSRFRRCEASVSSRHKTTNYLDNILARNEARDSGADEAVMLNSQGRIACASSANIFIIMDDGLVITPPVREGALKGIVRGLLLEHAGEIGVDITEAPCGPDFFHLGAPFLTNSLIGLQLARQKDAAAAKSLQAEIFNQLRAWYQNHLHRHLTESKPGL